MCPCTKGMNKQQDKATGLLTVLVHNRDIDINVRRCWDYAKSQDDAPIQLSPI